MVVSSAKNTIFILWSYEFPLVKFLNEGKRLRQETIYFDFRLDIDGSNLNHVNEFVPVTKRMQKNEIPEKLKSLFTQLKALRKLKEKAARGLSSVFKKSGFKFFLLQRFLNLFFSLGMLIFSCVLEFWENFLQAQTKYLRKTLVFM